MSRRNPRFNKQGPIYAYEYSQYTDPHEVVCGLLNGVDIILVDPRLYSLIQPELKLYKGRYSDSGDTNIVAKIEWMLQYMDEYPERQRIQQKLQVTTSRPKKIPQPFSDEELKREIDAIIEGNLSKEYTHDQSLQLLKELRLIRSDYIEDENYDDADVIDDRIKILVQRGECEQALQFSRERSAELKQKIEEASAYLDDLKKRWNNVMNNFQKQKADNLQKLQDDQCKEYTEEAQRLQKTWPKTLPKKSPTLLQLQRREEAMVAAKKYAEAEAVKREAEAFEQNEQNEYQAQWDAANNLKLAQLAEKQRREMSIRTANLKRDEETMKKAMRSETGAAEHKLETLKAMLARTEADLEPISVPPQNVNQTVHSSGLPLLHVNAAERAEGPQTFRQRALLNMKIYTRRPPASARNRAPRRH